MERAKSHILGLDKMLGGGVPKGASVLLTGPAGCGKTLFALQFVAGGASEGETGLYISFEENRRDLIEQAAQFDMDLERLERSGKFKMLNFDMSQAPAIAVLDAIVRECRAMKVSRLAFDSVTVLGIFASIAASAELSASVGKSILPSSNETVLRGTMMGLISRIKAIGATTILVSELPESTRYLSRDTVSEFVCDGIIRMDHKLTGKSRTRHIEIVKMRKTLHDDTERRFVLSKRGISIL
jgi:circadian clock protein KaiC